MIYRRSSIVDNIKHPPALLGGLAYPLVDKGQSSLTPASIELSDHFRSPSCRLRPDGTLLYIRRVHR